VIWLAESYAEGLAEATVDPTIWGDWWLSKRSGLRRSPKNANIANMRWVEAYVVN